MIKHITALSMILACSAFACGGSDDKPAASANDVTTTTSTTTDPNAAAAATTPAATPAVDPNAANTNGAAMTATAPAAAPAAPAAPAVTLSDAQIAAVVAAANQGEIDAAKIEEKQGKNADAKKFAAHMVSQHSDWAKQETALLKTKKMTMADSDTSTKLKSDNATLATSLKSSKGADLDKAYMDSQVKGHQAVLDMLDNTLIPQAQDADLKTMLTTVRGHVADHLQSAKDIQAKL